MDNNKEYHDPDYPEAAVCVKEESPSISEEEKVEKIKSIIRREFSNELDVRESEVMLIDQRMGTSRRLLHKLRYALVTSYYADQKLQLTNGQIDDEIAAQKDPRARAEVASILRGGQRQLHPSVRKLLGKEAVDMHEIFRTTGPRNKTRKDYSAMLQKRNYTSPAPPGRPAERKVPRQLQPAPSKVLTLEEAARNQHKHRYRIIIGNTSKYVPASSRVDRSTHKWLLYIRGTHSANIDHLVTSVTVTLHHSYAPHHTVHLHKPPYHVTRRGWGEFPARIELHFPLPSRNRPAIVEHRITLDRNYTGMQVLGSETVVDVWLYSTPDMLHYEFKEETQENINTDNTEQTNEPQLTEIPEIKTEDTTEISDDNWMDFFTKAPTELDVDEMIIKPEKKIKIEAEEEIAIQETNVECNDIGNNINNNSSIEIEKIETPSEIFNQPSSVKKRIVKYIDPTTGKIYYLEMDRELDLSKVQEIIINNTAAKISPIKNGVKNVKKKKGISLLKPEIKSLLKNEYNKTEKVKADLSHIENDHCYLATPKLPQRIIESIASVEIKKEKSLYDCLCSVVHRFTSMREAVNYLVKKIPLISDEARDPDFLKHFPFVVDSPERYWKLDFAKRRNIEWSRAKLIQRIMSEHCKLPEAIWRTKQILLYIRLHGHYPVRNETAPAQTETNEWSSWNDLDNLRKLESNIKEAYPDAKDINTLSAFNFDLDRSTNESLEISDDEEIDVIGTDVRPEVKREPPEVCALDLLPVQQEHDRLRFLFVEKKCQDIGIELRNEDVGNGYSYSAVHAVLVSAMRSFAEELLRGALAAKRRRESTALTVWQGCPTSKTTISLLEVYAAADHGRLRALTSRDVATRRKHTYAV